MKALQRSTRRKAGAVYFSLIRLGLHLVKQVRYRQRLKAFCNGKSGLLLNIGCGPLTRENWVNIDYSPIEGKSFYLDALDEIPIADGSVRHIHCEHFLEHLEYSDALSFMNECYRVLESGGTMRIIVPDAERYMRAYCSDDKEFFAKLINLGGHSEPLTPKIRVCNHMFRMWGDHRFAWDFETLEHAANRIGFSKVSRSKSNDIESAYNIDGQDWWRAVESLYTNLEK